MEKIEFIGYFPAIQSAINMDGIGNGARIKIDIPQSDIMAVMKLQTMCLNKSLKITIEPIENE